MHVAVQLWQQAAAQVCITTQQAVLDEWSSAVQLAEELQHVELMFNSMICGM